MVFQYLIVGIIIVAAVAYAAYTLLKKRRAFSTKLGCGSDCGCGDGS